MKIMVSSPIRLDMFLLSKGCVLSRAKAQRAVKDGNVNVNGSAVFKPSFGLNPGDEVQINAKVEAGTDLMKTDLKLKILYEDADCMVIEKPRGITVHPGAGMQPGEVTMLNGLAFIFSKQSIPFSPSGALVHRLDKQTSGCLLIAKNSKAQLKLRKQFHDRKVLKQYLALVAGNPTPAEAIIEADIGRNMKNRMKMSVFEAGKTRSAKTTYRTLSKTSDAALLKIDIHSGRTHQIRVHLKTVGHPVLGDRKYGDKYSENIDKKYSIDSLCLHAWKLGFISPSGKQVEIRSCVPDDFKKTADMLGLYLILDT